MAVFASESNVVNFYRQFIFVSHYVLVSKKIPEYDVFSGFSHNQTSDLSPTRLSGVEDNVNSLFRKYSSPQRLNSPHAGETKIADEKAKYFRGYIS